MMMPNDPGLALEMARLRGAELRAQAQRVRLSRLLRVRKTRESPPEHRRRWAAAPQA